MILVVDDEHDFRELIGLILRNAGYHVVLADGGFAALNIVHDLHSKLALMITDIVMPDLFGDELAKRVECMAPGLPILFMSGNSPVSVEPAIELHEGVNFLRKPFHPEALLELVRSRFGGPLLFLS